jgi:hypothetical protein
MWGADVMQSLAEASAALRDDTRCPACPASGEDPSGRDQPAATSLKYLRVRHVWHRPLVGMSGRREGADGASAAGPQALSRRTASACKPMGQNSLIWTVPLPTPERAVALQIVRARPCRAKRGHAGGSHHTE